MLNTIPPDDLDRIVLDTLALFVGGNTTVEPDWRPEGTRCATVRLDGTVDGNDVAGSVVVVADDASAACIAGSMLGLAAELCEEADIVDVLGEVANTIGGNVKACLGDGLQLSLPSVREGDLDAGALSCRGYRCDELGIAVAMFHDDPEGE